MEKENQAHQLERHTITVKGTSWLLQHLQSRKELSAERKPRIEKVLGQSRKWKKNVNNRFEGYSRTIQKTIESRFKREIKREKPFDYDSLGNTLSQLNARQQSSRLSQTFSHQRQKIKESLFSLERKQKAFEMQVAKMQKLKDITDIFEKKKLFYDNCIQEYFTNQENEINRTITKIAHRSMRASRNQIKRH